MILQELDGYIRIRKEPHEIKQFLGRHRPGAFFFHLGRTGAANAQLEVRSRQNHATSLRLQQDVGEDRDGGLLFDHALGEIQLADQIRLAYSEFHAGSCYYFSVSILNTVFKPYS